jgi:hypothetical protein
MRIVSISFSSCNQMSIRNLIVPAGDGDGPGDDFLARLHARGEFAVGRNLQVVAGIHGPFEDVGLVDAAHAVDAGHLSVLVVLDQNAEGLGRRRGVHGEEVVADDPHHLAELAVALQVAVAVCEAPVIGIDESHGHSSFVSWSKPVRRSPSPLVAGRRP